MIKIAKSIDNIRPLMLNYFIGEDCQCKHVICGNYYEWYYSYARQYKPRRVLEIGVRWGYSVIAMYLGSSSIDEFFLVDSEVDGIRLDDAIWNIRRLIKGDAVIKALCVDTQKTASLGFDGMFDIIHIDGHHSASGITHDLNLVYPLFSPKGIIICDDMEMPEMKTSVEAWASEHQELELTAIFTFTGHYLVTRKSQEKRK